MKKQFKKNITINDLAVMVAKGFEHVGTEIGGIKKDVSGLKQDVSGLKKDVSGLKQDMADVKHQMQALSSNVNNYLELSEKRYSELKQRDALLAKWLKLVADKTGVPIDVSQLEKI